MLVYRWLGRLARSKFEKLVSVVTRQKCLIVLDQRNTYILAGEVCHDARRTATIAVKERCSRYSDTQPLEVDNI